MTISLPMYRALCYADVFYFPLRLDEMRRFAICVGRRVLAKDIARNVVQKNGYYCLRGRTGSIQHRMEMIPIMQAKLRRAKIAARVFSFFPMVSAVFITGGLAVGNVREADDIDFMIVTKPGWLWTSRFFLVGISKLLRNYTHKRARREDATIADANTWCLNYWLDETVLTIPSRVRNLYVAHEVLQATALFDRSQIARRFLHENGWIKKYVVVPQTSLSMKKPVVRKSPSIIERFFFWFQRSAIQQHSAYARSARFFPKETGDVVLKKFETFFLSKIEH